jgi:hypothetical protein
MPKASETILYHARFVTPGDGTLTYHGMAYDQGQLLTLMGGARDEQLIRLGYVAVAEKEAVHLRAQCGVCGADFLNETMRDRHGRRRHRDRYGDELDVTEGMASHMGAAAIRDTTGDAEERRLLAEAPLYLEKTKASQQ